MVIVRMVAVTSLRRDLHADAPRRISNNDNSNNDNNNNNNNIGQGQRWS